MRPFFLEYSRIPVRDSAAADFPQFPTLAQGKELNVDFTVIGGKISFEGFTVEGWGDQGSVDGEIII